MKFDFTANPSTQLLRLERGEVDLMGDTIPAADWVRTKNDPTWSKYTITAPQIAWYYVFMNVLEKPFTDEKVRQAVNYAIDTEKVQKLLAGQGSALNQIYPDGMPGHQADKTFYTYDPAKAKQLLSEAGFPTGFKCTFVTHNVDPFPKLAQAVQADLKAVGIDCEIKQMDRATYWDYIALKKSHAAIGLSDWYMDFPDPSDWIGPLFTNPIDGGANSSFYENAEVNTLYEESAERARRGHAHRHVRADAGHHHDRRADGAALPAAVERHVRQEHGRGLHPPGVDLHLPGVLEDERAVTR